MKTALLLSGGMDSIALAWWKKPDIAITVDYGQLAAKAEICASKSICNKLGIPHKIIETNCRSLGTGDLVGTNSSNYAAKTDWWPYRNQLIITLCAMSIIDLDIKSILIGTVKSDEYHLDGSPNFISTISKLISEQEANITVAAPAINMTTIELIKKSGIPSHYLSWSHSCHKSNVSCGNCRGCNKYYNVYDEMGYELDRSR